MLDKDKNHIKKHENQTSIERWNLMDKDWTFGGKVQIILIILILLMFVSGLAIHGVAT